MKKLVLTIAIVLGLGLTTFADPETGGLFGRGETRQSMYNSREGEDAATFMRLPSQHNAESGNGDQPAPLGGGVLLLAGFGAAYMIAKKRREE
ncbi:MAG: hypothetical protein J6P83_04335 [Bacteroidales bacterium]|nr:hypothetical protein [Bacteroidales bacterium]